MTEGLHDETRRVNTVNKETMEQQNVDSSCKHRTGETGVSMEEEMDYGLIKGNIKEIMDLK